MSVRWTAEQVYALSGKVKAPRKSGLGDGYQSRVQGWRTIGGNKNYFKSLWEINYAKYLQWLLVNKSIKSWEYEPETFAFPKESYKAGPFYYKPDFLILNKSGTREWHEVKGWLNTSSKKKIKRFQKHYPNEGDIILIGKEWFKKNGKMYSGLIPGWESLRQ